MKTLVAALLLAVCSTVSAVESISFESVTMSNVDSKKLEEDRKAALDRARSESVAFANEIDRNKVEESSAEKFRIDTINQIARSYGMQAGLKFRYDQINELLESGQIPNLNSINFHVFLKDEVLLLPSVDVINNYRELRDSALYTANVVYKVKEEARIVTRAPTYHDYLIQRFEEPRKIHDALKPRSALERAAYDKATREGWNKGVQQANEIFSDGLSRLVRDVKGRINYMTLLKNGVVKPPVLVKESNAVAYVGREQRVGEIIHSVGGVFEYENIDNVKAAWVVGERDD